VQCWPQPTSINRDSPEGDTISRALPPSTSISKRRGSWPAGAGGGEERRQRAMRKISYLWPIGGKPPGNTIAGIRERHRTDTNECTMTSRVLSLSFLAFFAFAATGPRSPFLGARA